jgi:hypothetical protein
MSGFTPYAKIAFLNSLVGATSNFGALASVPDLFVGLSTTDVAADGTGFTEATGTGYARVDISAATFDTTAANSGGTTTISNDTLISFPTAGGDWSSQADMVCVGLFDASSSGNLLFWAALTTDKPVLNGDTMTIPIGDLDLQMISTTP